MKKLFSLCVVLALAYLPTYSQEDSGPFAHKGIIRAMATITPGVYFKGNGSSISLHGNLEYYNADQISIRSDIYYYFDYPDGMVSMNHGLFSGISYHLPTKGNFDPYLAFQPGLALVKGRSYDGLFCDPGPCPYTGNTTINPMTSEALGFNYYFQKLFHLFVEARFIQGNYLSDAPSPVSLAEIRFSFGLGFNLDLLSKSSKMAKNE